MSDWKTLSENSIKGVHQGLLERQEVFPIDFVFQVRRARLHKGQDFGIFEGLAVRLTTHTINTFVEKGCKCVKCGLEGSYFALERHPNAIGIGRRFRLYLYGVNELGEEVTMTRDHILPKSLGGKNSIDNHDPMCVICNRNKSNYVEETSIDAKPNKS